MTVLAQSRVGALLYPELASLPDGERAAALACARGTDFDAIELFGLAFALVAATAATRYSLIDAGLMHRLAVALLNFAVALPLIALCAGPFLIRRTRRGLRAYVAQRHARQGRAPGAAP
jgi:hypothetical protein